MKKFLIIFSLVILLFFLILLFFIIFNFFSKEIYKENNFWSYHIIDFTTLILTILITIFIAFIFNDRYNNTLKRKELILHILNIMESTLCKIYNLSITLNFSSIKHRDENEILVCFDHLDRNIIILQDKSVKMFNNELKIFSRELFNYKKIITDSPFLTDKYYSEDRLTNIKEKYFSLCDIINDKKFKLFE